MIGSVAVFVIFAIFYMIVTEKIKDLGIIKSLGASKWALAQVFLGYGALVGMVGSLLGTALGCAIVLNANKIEGWLNQEFGFRLWPPDIYAIDKIPDVVNFSEAAIIALVAVLASLAGALLPARRAAKLVVVDALRIE
jgi:lipoprotein-releasing system permease protein